MASVEDLLSQLQGGATEQSSSIGVPSGYVAKRVTQQSQSDVFGNQTVVTPMAPLYSEGMQYDPAAYSPDDIQRLQIQLFNAGMLDFNYRPGVWDDKSTKAYESVLAMANQSGLDKDAMITRLVETRSDTSSRQAQVLTVRNPDEIAQVVKSASSKILGRGLTDTEVQRLVNGYQEVDREYQERYNAAQEAAALGQQPAPVQEAPTADTYVEDELQQLYPQEATEQRYLGRMRDFYSFISQPAGGVLGGGI